MPVTDITIEAYQEQFSDVAQYQLVDVREETEYEDGHLPGAINIPLSDFQNQYDAISEDTPVVLVCARGGRSSMAAAFMLAQGYDEIFNLIEGTMEWIKRGLPVETET